MKAKSGLDGEGRERLGDVLRTLYVDYERHSASCAQRVLPTLVTYRLGRWAAQRRGWVGYLGGKLYGASLMTSELVSGVFLDRATEVGEDIHFVHGGNINIHPNTKIGNRVGIMQGVTLGTTPASDEGPTIEDDVFIGANASVLGPVVIGAGARVAANSLVLRDIPPGALAIGVPAKVMTMPFSAASKTTVPGKVG